jgi:hypothetical protein
LGFATKHLSTDRFLGRQEFSEVLEQVGFRKVEINPWTFIPTGNFPVLIRLLLVGLAKIGRCIPTAPLQGGLGVCVWKASPHHENAPR